MLSSGTRTSGRKRKLRKVFGCVVERPDGTQDQYDDDGKKLKESDREDLRDLDGPIDIGALPEGELKKYKQWDKEFKEICQENKENGRYEDPAYVPDWEDSSTSSENDPPLTPDMSASDPDSDQSYSDQGDEGDVIPVFRPEDRMGMHHLEYALSDGESSSSEGFIETIDSPSGSSTGERSDSDTPMYTPR